MRKFGRLPALLQCLLLILCVSSAFAQGDWTATLVFDPYPSAYITDWENNPNIGQALITNGSGETVRVRVYLTVNRGTQRIAEANSNPLDFPPGSSSNITTAELIDDQSIEYDHDIEDIAIRTGRLPEGTYQVCIRIEDEGGTVLLSDICQEFTIVYPDPPYLIYPLDGESVLGRFPIFQWTPVQVPVGFGIHYNFRMAELLPGQTASQALAANMPHFEDANVGGSSLQYPISAQSFVKDRTYAWQVQVLDNNGYPPSTNDGRSEIWTFRFDADTTTPVELRTLAGQVVDAETGRTLDSARVVYRPVSRNISGADTTWTPGDDSAVWVTDPGGNFKIDSAYNKSYYTLEVSRKDYSPLVLSGREQYLDGDVRNKTVRLTYAPPGTRRLAGVLKDFYSNEPVANALVTYHAVEVVRTEDTTGGAQFQYVEVARKALTATTDAEGRFEFTKAADSSYFSLRAEKTPSYLPSVDIGPDQRQQGDIDQYIFLIKPNAGVITGVVKTIASGGIYKPVPRTLVQLSRTATVQVTTRFWGAPVGSVQSEVTVAAEQTAYTDGNGLFRMLGVSQEKAVTVHTVYGTIGSIRIPMFVTTSTPLSYSYKIVVEDPRYQPYISPEGVTLTSGESTDTGEHLLRPKAGSIVGRVLCDSLPVEGASVYLYPATHRPRSGNQGSGGGSGRADNALGPDEGELSGGGSEPTVDTTWGNSENQKPSGEPLDVYQTDQTGAYALANVPINDPEQVTERYTVWVEAQGFGSVAKPDRIDAENEVDTVNFGLARVGGILFGRVTSSAGAQLSGVRVQLHRADSLPGGGTAWNLNAGWMESGGDGSYSFANLTPGTYRLRFSKTGCTTLTTGEFPISYGDRFQRDEELSAAKGFIALTVKKKDDKAVSDVCVKSPEIPSLIGFTNQDGLLLISEAIADSVHLQLRKLGYADLDTTVVVTADDTLKVSVKIEKSIGQVFVRVVEKGNTNKRLQDMIVKIGDADPDTTGLDGVAYFEEAPTGQQKVKVSAPTDESSTVDYVAVETQVTIYPGLNAAAVVVEMAPAARIEGTVKAKEGGLPIDKVAVAIEGNDKVTATTNSDGVFRLRNVPAGESVTLTARKAGYKTAKLKREEKVEAGAKITGLTIEMEASPMDSLFGFAVALDSIQAGSDGKSLAWGSLIDVPATFGVTLKNPAEPLNFAALEVGSNYRPVSDTVKLTTKSVDLSIFGVDGSMSYDGGLRLEWIDSVKAGRICGDVTIKDPISKIMPETKFIDFKIPKSYAPSFWAGGVNRGLSKYGITATNKEVQVQIKAVKLGLDYTQSCVDTAGLHLFGSIEFGSKFKVGFEEMLIGRNADGEITLKSITLKTEPAIKIPFGVFTVVDSSMTWESTGFRASGAIVLNALDNREYGFKDLRISPEGEFLSLTLTADEKNGTINVHGQKFQIESLEFGTENFESETLEHTKYFAFAGKLTVTALEKPVGMKLRYAENGRFTGKLEFNQSVSFKNVVTLTLESIELGYDSSRTEQFIGLTGGVKFGAINGLNVQASDLRFYFDGAVTFREIALGFVAGPASVDIRVSYGDGVFEGKGLLEVKPVFSAGAEFRYGGSRDWWVRIISGTRIPIGPAEIVQASGGIGRKDDTWKFSIGGIVAPAKADKGIRLDILVEVQKTPKGVIILGNANVEVGGKMNVGRATFEINLPEERIMGSIVFAMDVKAAKASAQLDLGVQFGRYWYIYGRATLNVIEIIKADGVIVIASNWEWQHNGQTRLMNGIYIEVGSSFGYNANWYVIKFGLNFEQRAKLDIDWNHGVTGSIEMSGNAYAWIGFDLGLFTLDLIEARGRFALGAHVVLRDDEVAAGANGSFSLEGTIGSCPNAGCWSICWRCYCRIFGACIFALPTGAKGCISMNAAVEYSNKRGLDVDVSF